MILLSAQPDEPYFFWQLEVFLHSTSNLKYPPDRIHVLIGYNPFAGISPLCKEFMLGHADKAEFFTYPDIRVTKMYISSIRPHIIKQHYASNPFLQQEVIFYHDSDIVFTKWPDFDELIQGDAWYVSDTKEYLSAEYIENCGASILPEMCKIVGIEPQTVKDHNNDAGGAQYIIKRVNYLFWEKVEKDAEELFKHLNANKERYAAEFSVATGKPATEYHGIQDWCSDMWSLLWNGYYFGYVIKVHPKLSFLWPMSNINEWDDHYIYHDAGVYEEIGDTLFHKGKYLRSFPFYFDKSFVSKSVCSIQYVKLIDQVAANKKYDLSDVTFLLSVRIDSDDRLKNLFCTLAYINKHFTTNISILEADSTSKVPESIIKENIRYKFIYDNNPMFYRTYYNNLLCKETNTPIIAITDTDIIISPEQLYMATISIRHNESDMVSPYDGDFLNVESGIRDHFLEEQNIGLLNSSREKVTRLTRESWGGTLLVSRNKFQLMGLDNENLIGYGPEDIERPRRARILGLRVKREKGPLFHLAHHRSENSYYFNDSLELKNKAEFLKICDMSTAELAAYVNTWAWAAS